MPSCKIGCFELHECIDNIIIANLLSSKILALTLLIMFQTKESLMQVSILFINDCDIYCFVFFFILDV